MWEEVFKELEAWIEEQNRLLIEQGLPSFRSFKVHVMGQIALMIAAVPLDLAATQDVDAKMDCDHEVKKKFDELLKRYGKHWDPLSHEIWMPKETEYEMMFQGKYMTAAYAKPEFVLLSKALKDPRKNRNLMIEYIAKGPSDLFMKLATQYGLDLEEFVNG